MWDILWYRLPRNKRPYTHTTTTHPHARGIYAHAQIWRYQAATLSKKLPKMENEETMGVDSTKLQCCSLTKKHRPSPSNRRDMVQKHDGKKRKGVFSSRNVNRLQSPLQFEVFSSINGKRKLALRERINFWTCQMKRIVNLCHDWIWRPKRAEGGGRGEMFLSYRHKSQYINSKWND